MAPSTYRDPIGWPFLPMPDQNGVMTYPTLDQSVRDAIRILLTTRAGEQLMSPFFGIGLQNYLEESNTVAIRRQIQSAVTSALQQYEGRITVDGVDVSTVDGAPSEIRVQIHYRELRTNMSKQFGVTLQTE
jgi:phage baseplate assembly protein W